MTDKHISWDEAVLHIMRTTGKSRRAARRELESMCRKGKLPAFADVDGKMVRLPKETFPKWLTPEEAVKLMDDDPSMVLIPLGDFLRGLTPAELLGELRSGRLVARGSEEAFAEAKRSKHYNIADFTVDAQRLIEWMANPQTPPDLVEKFHNGVGKEH